MKQMKLFLVALMSLLVSNVALADDKPIPVDQLPATAKAFVQSNFKGKKIVYAEKDWNSYECRLNDGTEIEFNKKGKWEKIDCQKKAVPATLIPDAIKKYVEANFKGILITKIDQGGRGYEVELSNDLDLKFNDQGKFIGMDD